MAFRIPDPLAGSGGLSVEGDVEIDAFSNEARLTAVPSTVVISLTSLPLIATGTVLANVTAGTAQPTAHPLATLAGDGLTYTNVTGVFDVIDTWSNVLARGALSGANNPTISTGQHIAFQTGGLAAGDIRSAEHLNLQAGTGFHVKVKDAFIAGDEGTEGSGITIQGSTFESSAKVSDIGGTNPAQFILHRHSTSLEPVFVTSRSNTDDDTHAVVTDGQGLGTWYAVGWDGTDYAYGGYLAFIVDGTPGSNDMPTRFVIATTADGAGSGTERLRIASTGAWGLAGANYGTTGQVFTSNGPAAAPTWEDATGGGGGSITPPDGINLTATDQTIEVDITGGGVADWEASFVDMSTGTEGSTTTNNFSSASNTVVAAPGASVQRVVTHASLYCITAGSFTIQKDVAATNVVLVGPLSLDVGERVEFTSSSGWRTFFADGSEKTGSGSSSIYVPIPKFDTTHSPVLLINFEDVVTDLSGNGLSPTPSSAKFAEVYPGFVAMVSGSASRASNDALLTITGDITILALFSFDVGALAGDIVEFANNAGTDSNTVNNTIWRFGADQTNGLYTFHEIAGGANVTITGVDSARLLPRTGVPIFAAVTRIADVHRFYLQGLPYGTVGAAATTPVGGTASFLVVHGQAGASPNIASLKVVASGLTAAEIKAEYNRTLGVAFTPLP